MKKIINIVLFVVSLSVFSTPYAQVIDESYCPMYNIEEPEEGSSKLMSNCNSSTDICTGKYKPGKGTLKMLMVYIRFADDNTSMSYWNSTPNPSDIYDVETWMEESLDENSSVGSDNYFNVTNYFNQMSRGSYTVIGDVVYVEVPSKSTFTDDGTPSGTPLIGLELMEATNKYALEYLDNSSQIDLSDYDNFDYVSNYHHDQSSDNILDMVYMVYRTPGQEHFTGPDSLGYEHSSFGGIARLGKASASAPVDLSSSGLKVDYGLYGEGSGLTMHLGNDRKDRFDDSYIHELAHYLMGYNHPYTDGNPSVGRTGYWGIFGGNQATNSINAYEQELLGWITPTELTNTNTFWLDDFLSTGASYKYTISSSEFYYFENRQKVLTTTGIDDTYDQPNWNDNDKGLFVLHVKENANGNYLYSWDNSLESVVSDGNYDWNLDGWSVACGSDPATDLEPVFEKSTPNRFGESFKDPLLSVTKPTGGASYKQSLFIKPQNTSICKRYFLGYDSDDKSGFTTAGKKLITPYTNPALLARDKSQVGIGLKIIQKQSGSLNIKFYDNTSDFYNLTEDMTWEGDIFLEETVNIEDGATLTILPGTDVYIGDYKSITVRPGGKLLSQGTEEKPIHFQRLDPAKQWNRISLNSSEGNVIEWSNFTGGYINLSIASKNNTITHTTLNSAWRPLQGWHNQDGSGNASATISYVHIKNSTSVGFVAQYINVDMSYTTISGSNDAGLYIYSGSVYPFHHNLITNNGFSRDGIEINSSGTLYMQESTYGYGYNEVSNNGKDQIASYGNLLIAPPPYLGNKRNSIHGDHDLSTEQLVENNTSNTVDAFYTWWGEHPTNSGMFDGPIDTYGALTSDPTNGVPHGAGGQVPAKALPGSNAADTRPVAEIYQELEEELEQAKNNQEVRDGMHRLYQLSDMSRKQHPELNERFRNLAKNTASGSNNLYSSASRNTTLRNTANVLQAKYLVKDGEFEKAKAWLSQTKADELDGYDRRDWLHLQVATQTYHGKYETAWETLQEYYAFQKSQGENMEEVRAHNSPIEEELRMLIEAGNGIPEAGDELTEQDSNELEFSVGNYPNPFNPTTNIRFTLPERSQVSLVVYDMLGREVAMLVDNVLSAGEQTVRFDASHLSNGMYLYKLRAGGQEIVNKMTLIK